MTQHHVTPAGELNPHQHAELKTLSAPVFHSHLRRESLDLAYLLGAWVACTEIGGKPDNRVSFATQDERQLALLEPRLARISGKPANRQFVDIHGTYYHRAVLHNEEIAQHFQRVTAFNSRVPWEHLGTQAEKIHFIAGMFDHGGWIFTGSSSGIGINKRDGEHLLKDVARLFARVGMHPILNYNEVASLRLKDQLEWHAFAATIPLSLSERRERVHQLTLRPCTRNQFTIADYQGVTRAFETGEWTPPEIAKATGVPDNTVRDWVIRGQKPPAVKRKEIIDAFSATMPNPEVINTVYRALGASSALACECGARTSVEKARSLANQVANESDLLFGNDERIAAELLGHWAAPLTIPRA